MKSKSAPVPRQPHRRIGARAIDPDVVAAAQARGLTPLSARVLAGRVSAATNLDTVLMPKLAQLSSFEDLPDIQSASERLARAVESGAIIAIESDHDSDGVSGHCILLEGLTRVFGHPRARVQSYIGHRLRDGYGLSQPVAARILAASPKVELVITVDNGSSDEARIAQLARHGIETIVTDHHLIPRAGVPASALACVSPARDDSTYPDKAIAGCMVAWLLLAATKRVLAGRGHLPEGSTSLAGLLDWVALGTVADAVNLASPNNRAVVCAGLARIEAGVRPCWRAIRPYCHAEGRTVTATDLAFAIAPRLNARGRLNDAYPGVAFLMSENDAEAEGWVKVLDHENTERRKIERRLLEEADALAQALLSSERVSLEVYLKDGHPGVHGIVAGRLAERYGRPTLCLSPKVGEPEILAGSLRAAAGVDVRQALQWAADQTPALFVAFGGHAAAAGVTVELKHLKNVLDGFERGCRQQLPHGLPATVIETDGKLSGAEFQLDTVRSLAQLEPYGRGFPLPRFAQAFTVTEIRPVGNGAHWRLRLRTEDRTTVVAIWFNASAAGGPAPIAPGARTQFVYELRANSWHGKSQLEVVIRDQVGAITAPSHRHSLGRMLSQPLVGVS